MDNLVSFLDYTPGTTVTASSVGSTITLIFENMMHNGTITFFSSGRISDGNSNATDKKLTLTFDATMRNGDTDPDVVIDLPMPGFRATWQ